MNRAVFLDRDGVLNANVFNKATGEPESPHAPAELDVFPWVVGALRRLQENGFHLFLVSNQPSCAKGKASMEALKSVHAKFHAYLENNGIRFGEYFYCYHHPDGIVPEFSGVCACRKPGTLSLTTARQKYDLDMASSWMVGDRDIDVLCAQGAGVRAILIEDREELKSGRSGHTTPDHRVRDLSHAVDIILGGSL